MILDEIVAYKRIQLEEEKKFQSIDDFIRGYEKVSIRNFKEAICREEIAIISEIKKSSPSKGIIQENFNPEVIAKVYESIGTDALSVLTERKFFLGDDSYIKMAKEANSKPVLRKDFIIDEFQIHQSKAIGADAVLLIASLLGKDLKRFYNKSREIGLHCLVEVHNLEELDIALKTECDIIGINNRDLKTFDVDLITTEKLMKYIPKGITVVSESGIKSPEDIKYLEALGIKAVLIGETFMRNIEDIDKMKDFIKKSRGVR